MSGLDGKQLAFGWIIGYFLFTYPIRMWLPHPLIVSLLNAIVGISIAIIFLWVGRSR